VAVPRQRITLPPASWRRAVGGLVRGNLWDGPEIERFERDFASLIGVEHAIAVASGRAGLRFILESLQLEPGAEVICSAFGYPVVPYLAKSMGYDVHFVDCEMQTLGMDPERLADAISDRTAAVITTHLYGIPSRVEEIAEIARAHGAHLVEDCAHCCGASVNGRQTGAFGSAAYFSFETSKMINTMGGGMITTSDAGVAERIRAAGDEAEPKTMGWLAKRLARTTFESAVTSPLPFNLGVYPALRLSSGKEEDRFASGYHGDHVTMRGRTGRYTNYQAKLGLSQMVDLDERLARRVANARRLIDPLQDRVHFQQPAGPHAIGNYMLVTALFPNRAEVGDALLRRGVDTKHHYMRDCSGIRDDGPTHPNAARAENDVLHLPAFPELSTRSVDRVVAAVRDVVEQHGAPLTEGSLAG